MKRFFAILTKPQKVARDSVTRNMVRSERETRSLGAAFLFAFADAIRCCSRDPKALPERYLASSSVGARRRGRPQRPGRPSVSSPQTLKTSFLENPTIQFEDELLDRLKMHTCVERTGCGLAQPLERARYPENCSLLDVSLFTQASQINMLLAF